jgi:hypothetical protein
VISVTDFLANCQFPVLPPTSLFVGFSTAHFYLFTKIKLLLTGNRFESTKVMQENTINFRKTLKNGDFQKFFVSENVDGVGVLRPKERVLKEKTAIKNQHACFSFVIYDLSPRNFQSHLVHAPRLLMQY